MLPSVSMVLLVSLLLASAEGVLPSVSMVVLVLASLLLASDDVTALARSSNDVCGDKWVVAA